MFNNPLKYTDPSGYRTYKYEQIGGMVYRGSGDVNEMFGGGGGSFMNDGHNGSISYSWTNGQYEYANGTSASYAEAMAQTYSRYGNTGNISYYNYSSLRGFFDHLAIVRTDEGNILGLAGALGGKITGVQDGLFTVTNGGSAAMIATGNNTVNSYGRYTEANWTQQLDEFQTALDVAGAIEPTPVCDITNAFISAFRGQWGNAGISALGIIPYAGDLAKGGKYGKKLLKLDYELIYRSAKGTDGGISRHIIERLDGEVISKTHQVFLDGKIIHQHQDFIGSFGTIRSFPEEWLLFPTIK